MFLSSRYKCFVYADTTLIGVGRALADGLDCSYICDIAVHPDHQEIGLGKVIVKKLVALSEEHKKIILYANPGKEGFYKVSRSARATIILNGQLCVRMV